jgi:hypothetical protein
MHADDHLFMFRIPPSYFWTRANIGANDRLDVVLDVSLLSTLVMQGNVTRKRPRTVLDISLRSASDAYLQIRT